jgi:DNA-directed RNA polymerase subunit RPC12/RpoP
MELITIKTFDNPINAHLLKVHLQENGIHSIINDEHIISLNPLYNLSMGGIKLKVNIKDLDKANLLISNLQKTNYTDSNGETLACPNCKSTDLFSSFTSVKNTKGIMSMIISFALAIFPFYAKKVYKCKECDHEFNNE